MDSIQNTVATKLRGVYSRQSLTGKLFPAGRFTPTYALETNGYHILCIIRSFDYSTRRSPSTLSIWPYCWFSSKIVALRFQVTSRHWSNNYQNAVRFRGSLWSRRRDLDRIGDRGDIISLWMVNDRIEGDSLGDRGELGIGLGWKETGMG